MVGFRAVLGAVLLGVLTCGVTLSWPGAPTASSSTRRAGMPDSWASESRWLRALRPPCTALASSSAPT